MNVFFEEDGGFKVARVMEDIGTSLHVEAVTGKRSKIKANAVLLRFESALAELLPQAEKLSQDIDPDFLYEASGDAEFAFDELALDYYGHKPSAVEAASCAIKLHAAPMYFYKRGKGRYQKAPADNLAAALASIERKKREASDMAVWVDDLVRGVMPEAMKTHMNQLLYKPDRNTLLAKACDKAVADSGMSLAQLFFNANAWSEHNASPNTGHMAQHDFHVGKFLADFFPKGLTPKIEVEMACPLDLTLADVLAYSIDDATTTEIDDAFSCRSLADGQIEVGIHIAAPALMIAPDSALDLYAKSRLSTVYYPGHKITMLPDAAVAAATLAAGHDVAVISLYAVFDDARAVVTTRSVIERVHIQKNLRLHELETWFTDEAVAAKTFEGEFGAECLTLHGIAMALKATRGAKDNADYVDYNFDIRNAGANVDISARVRGSPVDTVVAELMIFANSQWGKLLAENNIAAIYRVQQNMKTRMTTDALPHDGLGVAHYAWSSSPLRRYVDLVNQRQLIALISGNTPQFPKRSPALNEIARIFDTTYDAYAEFQRNMERFWCLRYLQERECASFTATIIREELVRASTLPLILKLKKSPSLNTKTAVIVNIAAIDYWAIGGEFSIDETLHKVDAPEMLKAT